MTKNLEICKECGEPRTTTWKNEDTPELTDLGLYIQSLFDYQGDVTSANSPIGKVETFAIGTICRSDDHSVPIDVLVGVMRERFQRVFEENRPSSRPFYWREKPVIMGQFDFCSQSPRFGLWMRFSLAGLTDDERKRLGAIPEGTAVEFKSLTKGIL